MADHVIGPSGQTYRARCRGEWISGVGAASLYAESPGVIGQHFRLSLGYFFGLFGKMRRARRLAQTATATMTAIVCASIAIGYAPTLTWALQVWRFPVVVKPHEACT